MTDMEQKESIIRFLDLMEAQDGLKPFLKWRYLLTTRTLKRMLIVLRSFNEDGAEIHMLAEKRYPLTARTLERMLSLGLIVESASDAPYDLLRFIQKQIDESGGYDRGEKDL
uniref:Uncharacterized protein n=1 Tax=Tanacetum cinerariifolium TaxID=118510 RepID=A0A699Q529_TANCI|nr:hypothetical protein [Tanacetum cinerariifolium]